MRGYTLASGGAAGWGEGAGEHPPGKWGGLRDPGRGGVDRPGRAGRDMGGADPLPGGGAGGFSEGGGARERPLPVPGAGPRGPAPAVGEGPAPARGPASPPTPRIPPPPLLEGPAVAWSPSPGSTSPPGPVEDRGGGWTRSSGGGPPPRRRPRRPWSATGWRAPWRRQAAGRAFPFANRGAEQRSGWWGSTRFGVMDPGNRRVEIGWTLAGPTPGSGRR